VPPRSWRLRIEDSLQAIARIEQYLAGHDVDSFRRDQRTIDAVIRNLEIVGEASRHVPLSIQERHPSVPWTVLSGILSVESS
jgi:uncharacterized protein with HEPN domain